jgi:hypothetical protein
VTYFARALAAWLVLLVAMTANGFVRALVLQPRMGEPLARQVSSVLGACIVLTLAGVFVRRLPDPGAAPLLRIGLLWGLLTVVFEFGLGHFVSGLRGEEMLADYDLAAGRLWPLVLLATVAGPPLWGRAMTPSMLGGHAR